MSVVVRLPDDVIDLINDVKLTLLNDLDDDSNDLAYQIVLNMNRMDIIRHCLNTVKYMHLDKE